MQSIRLGTSASTKWNIASEAATARGEVLQKANTNEVRNALLTPVLSSTCRDTQCLISTVGGQVAYGVGGQGLAVVTGQQILPGAVPIAVGDGVLHRAQRAGGVGILLLAEDVAAVAHL